VFPPEPPAPAHPQLQSTELLQLLASNTVPEVNGDKQPKGSVAFEAHLKPREWHTAQATHQPVSLLQRAEPSATAAASKADANEKGASSSASPSPLMSRSEAQKVDPAKVPEPGKEQAKPDSGPQLSSKQPQKETERAENRAPDLTLTRSQAPANVRPAEPNARSISPNSLVAETPQPPRHAEPVRAGEKLAAAAPLDLPEPATPRTEPARDISFRIHSATNPVDIKLTDRAGEIHVAVRSMDPLLTKSLQANVSELAGKLEKAGFHTETFIPGKLETLREPQASATFQDAPRDRRAPQDQQPRPKKPVRPSGATFEISMPHTTNQENR
jgi:hypothetical protein